MTASETPRARSAAEPGIPHQSTAPRLLRRVGLKTLRDERRSLAWWAAGSTLLSAAVIMLYPSIAVPELEEMLERMPPAIRVMLGEEIDLATVAGYLDLRLFTFLAPIIYLTYAIGRGTAATAGEEDRGTMDLLLSLPVQRWRIVVEKAIAMLVGLSIIGAGIWLGLVIGVLIVDVTFNIFRALQATLMGVLLGLLHGSLALAVGGRTGKTGVAIGVSAAMAVAGYFLHTLAPLVDWLEPFRVVSPFYYYIDDSAMLHGLNASHALMLLLISMTLISLAVLAFNRRDVQT